MASNDIKQELLDYLKNEIYVTVGVSNIHGVGLIAVKDIPKDTNILVAPPEGVVNKRFEIDKSILKRELYSSVCNLISGWGGHNDVVDIGFTKNWKYHYPLYINHSDEPNSYYNSKNDLITKLEINKGEELTVNYDEIPWENEIQEG